LGAKYDNQIAIIADIQGPKIRTGVMKVPFEVKAGDKIAVTPDEVIGTPELIQIKYETILKDLDAGDVIYINDGVLKLVVERKDAAKLYCVVEAGGTISDKKGVNIPSGNISLEVVRPKDIRDLELIAKLNPEWVAASFIGTADDVQSVRDYLKKFGNTDIKIISKIERPVALENLEAIIEASDAIMVARGDLGVEIDTWDVPPAQKRMCHLANAAGKPVIVATQMLESMISSFRPTRAETTDVYNAVLDGADAVMLSGETSVGKYPIEAVRIMDKIALAAEKAIARRNPDDFDSKHVGMTETLAHGFYTTASLFKKLGYTGKAIVLTGPPSGYVVRMISKYRPSLDIIAITDDLRTALECNLIWGVQTIHDPGLSNFATFEEKCFEAIQRCVKRGLLSMEDHVMVMARSLTGKHIGSLSAIYNVQKTLDPALRGKGE
jgi:pyruvate kinase